MDGIATKWGSGKTKTKTKKNKKKPLFLSWSSKQKCMKLKKKNDIERNNTKLY